MRFRLRTLLIVLAVGPILGDWVYRAVEEHLRYQRQQEALSKIRWQALDRDFPAILGEAMRRSTDQTVSPDENHSTLPDR